MILRFSTTLLLTRIWHFDFKTKRQHRRHRRRRRRQSLCAKAAAISEQKISVFGKFVRDPKSGCPDNIFRQLFLFSQKKISEFFWAVKTGQKLRRRCPNFSFHKKMVDVKNEAEAEARKNEFGARNVKIYSSWSRRRRNRIASTWVNIAEAKLVWSWLRDLGSAAEKSILHPTMGCW